MNWKIIIICLLLILSTWLFIRTDNTSTETVVIGNILTMNDVQPQAEAMLIRGNRIIALGTETEMMAASGDEVQIMRYPNQTIMPGFVAAHEHPTVSAVFRGLVDLSALTHDSPESARAALLDAIANAKPGEWVHGIGIDPILMPEMMLSRTELDRLAPDNPVVLISQFLHSFWVNTSALESVEIDESSIPEKYQGFYERDDSGQLTGLVIEEAGHVYIDMLKSPFPMANRLVEQNREYRVNGITTVASLGYNAPLWLLEWAGSEWGGTPIRQVIYLTKDELNMLPDSPENGDDKFRVAGIKLWYDGSPYSGTMYLEEPYLNSQLTQQLGFAENQTGHALLSKNQFTELFNNYDATGWQVAIHSQGDESTKELISLIEQNGFNRQLRHRFEHGLLFPEELLKKAVENNFSVSYHINHLLYYGNALEDSFLGSRAEQLLPLRSSIEQDMNISLHADSPMFPANPLSLMQTAILRSSRDKRIFNQSESLTPTQALKAMTIDAAWQLKMDKVVGSLEVGKFADYVVLDQDLLSTEVEQWHTIQVLKSCIAGDCTL